jgi:hypothetical protein
MPEWLLRAALDHTDSASEKMSSGEMAMWLTDMLFVDAGRAL